MRLALLIASSGLGFAAEVGIEGAVAEVGTGVVEVAKKEEGAVRPGQVLPEFSWTKEIASADGRTVIESDAQTRMDLAEITEAKAGESFVVGPTVVTRGVGFRVIESITRGIAPDGSELRRTNRYTVRGELKGEEVLPGVRTAVLEEPTVVQRGEGFKTVRSVSEFLNYDGSKTVTTNRYVELESEAALAEVEKPVVLEWGAHQKRVRKEVVERDGAGRWQVTTSHYTELGTGLAYQDEAGEWRDSVAEFELLKEGGAIARQTQHKVFLKANPNEDDPVQITLPDGKVLKSRVLGLGYFDRTSGQSVIIASLQDAEGELNAAKNEVSFPRAFRGIDATLRFVLSAAGIEQDVILHEQPGAPDDYDKSLRPETSELQVITEFFPSEAPEVKRFALATETDPAQRANMAEPDVTDEMIQFGSMYIGPGRAFSLGKREDEATREVKVMKQWQVIDGRTILFEAVSYPDVKPLLEKLPAGPELEGEKPRASSGRKLPARRYAEMGARRKEIRLAQNGARQSGTVIDYALLNSVPNLTLASETTYYLKNSISVSGGTTIQGGAVVKAGANASLNINGTVNCQTSSSAKAYFVAANDNTIGDAIVPGAPSGTYATAGINVVNTSGITLSYLEVRNALRAFDYSGATSQNLSNCRVVDCPTAVRVYGSSVSSSGLSLCGVAAEWTNSGSGTYQPSGTVTSCASPCGVDDHGDAIPRATAVTSSSSFSGMINCAGDEDFFSINVTSSTNVTVTASNTSGMVVHLLDATGFELLTNNNSNFSFSRALAPGMYYLRMRHQSPSGTGNYTLAVAQSIGTALVASHTMNAPQRNDYTGWLGFRFTVGSTPITVTELARWVVSGNSQSHIVKLVREDGVDLPGGSVTNSTAGKPAGAFAYLPLAAPVILEAGISYAVLSSEQAGGDIFMHDVGTAVTLSSAASGAISAYSANPPPLSANNSGQSYGPVNLRYVLNALAPRDDHGNFPTNATVTAENSSTAGQIETAGDVDYFRINVTANGTLTVYTGGTTDTIGYLYNAAQAQIATNDDYNTHIQPNFWMSYTVTPGAYYVKVKHFAATGTGGYVLYVQNTPTGYGKLVSSVTPDSYLRNNYSGWVGLGFTVGASPITVRELGRWVESGNTQGHPVRLVTAAGAYVAEVTVATSGQPGGGFIYAPLGSAVTLNANTSYALVSLEYAGGDYWHHDYNTKTRLSAVATGANSVVMTSGLYSYFAGASFVPVDLRFDVAQVGTPVFDPLAFSADHSQVTISATAPAGATVFYTVDGTDPTQANLSYPPVVSTPTTVKARAFQPGYPPSNIASISVSATAGVQFTPNGHNAIEYASGPINVTMTAETGATIWCKAGTSGSWFSVANGSSPVIDGIDSGTGTLQAYAYTATKLRGATTVSGEFAFRLPQPTSTATYGAAHTTGILTLTNSVIGANLYYTTDGVTPPTAASTPYSSPLNLTSPTKLLVRAYRAGYIPSGHITAWVNQLPAPRLATSSGVLAGNITVNNDTVVWLLPNFGFANAYGENRDMSGWYYANAVWSSEAPTPDYPGSFFGGVQNGTMVHSISFVPVSFGRTYSLAGWYRKDVAGPPCDFAGLYNQSDDGSPIYADDINESGYAATYLTAALADGATTAQVADATTFNQIPQPSESYFNIFTPLVNFSRTGPLQRANQPNAVSQIYQPMDAVAAGAMKILAVNGNVLTLQNAYHGPLLPVGTPVARRQAGSSYQYELFVCTTLPTTWTYFSKPFTYLRPGTESVRLLDLLYSGTTRFSGHEFWEGGVSDRPGLYYSLNGNGAVFASGTADPGPKKITLTGTATVSVGQRGTFYLDSPVLQRTITFQAGMPKVTTIVNSAGTQVTNFPTTVTAGAEIRFTTDGSEPTVASTLYTGGTSGVVLPATVNSKWKAFKANYTASDTATQLGVPTFSPPGGTYNSGQTITLTASAGAQLKVLQLNPNLINPSVWVAGSQGSQASLFFASGDPGENRIETRVTPYGTAENVWVGYNLDTFVGEPGWDGGWNTASFTIDKTKLYRFSVWIKKTDSTPATADGYTYLGCEWSTVSNLGAGEVVNGNPYFWVGVLPANDWYLLVGFVQPAGYSGTTSYSKVYDRQGNVVASGTDFKWLNTSTYSNYRTYLYYCTEAGIQQEFWNPRVELVNSVSDPLDVLFVAPENSPKTLTWNAANDQTVRTLAVGAPALQSPVNTSIYWRDSDGDGLGDTWENNYFGGLGQIGSGDPDGDGLTNLQEFQILSNPTFYNLLVYTPLQ